MKKLIMMLAALIALASCSQTEPPEPPVPDTPDPVVPEAKITPRQVQRAFRDAWREFYPETRSAYPPLIKSCVAYDKDFNPVTRSYNEPMFYVINLENDSGFAIMAATPSHPEVLAISNEGNLGVEYPADARIGLFMARLSDYVIANPDTIIEYPDTFAPYPGQIYTSTSPWSTTEDIPALCQVNWGETNPFNQFVPTQDFYQPPTGSDAVAIAQAFSVFGQPTSLGGYTFDWPTMVAATPSDNNAIQQIARLLQQINALGNFTYQASPCPTYADIDGLLDVMSAAGYDNAKGKLESGNLYSYMASTVRSELQASRPVIVRGRPILSPGQSAKWDHFHGWLVHGLKARQRVIQTRQGTEDGGYKILSQRTEKQDYVLINWGNFGSSNGYFLSNAYDINFGQTLPAGGETPDPSYPNNISMITNIYPTR